MADRKEDYVASSFDQAFARARRSGSKTFKWANPKTGKMGEYSTKMAGEETVTSKPTTPKPARSTLYSSPADTAKFRADRDKPRTGGGSPKTPSRGIAALKKAYGTAKKEQSKAEKGLKEASDTASRTTREMLADVPKMATEAALAATTPAAGRAVLPRMGGMSPSAIERSLARVPGRTVPNITAKDLMRGQSTPEIGKGLVDRLTEAARYSPETAAGLKKGGKVGTVMREFKAGSLKSSSGQKVTNPKQAIAIAMSEAGMKKPKKFAGKEGSYVGGQSKAPTTKEMTPKDLEAMGRTEVANQEAMRKAREEAKKNAAAPKRYAKGGEVGESKTMMKKEVAFMKRKGAPKSMIKHEEKEAKGMKSGGSAKCYAKGGAVRADGCATKGKTRGKMV